MKSFLFFVSKILIICLLLAVSLDFLYSRVYLQSSNRRKVGYAFVSKPKMIDVVILGSSRAENHFVSQMFIDKGLETFNFGMQGSRLFESDLILKILLEKKNVIKNVILEIDLNLRHGLNTYSEANTLKFLPFLYESKSVNTQFKLLPNYNLNYYLPFYRYLNYETKIGFREVFFSGINKKSKELDFGGFNALPNTFNEKLEANLSDAFPSRNVYYEEIKRICKSKNINLIAIMTPMCANTKGIDYFQKVKKLYPEIHNYENSIQDDKYFCSCGHMNEDGAKKFTARILNDFFKK